MALVDLKDAQEWMRGERIDAWLVHDFRGANPVFSQLTGRSWHTTRRLALLIPQSGAATLLVHTIDAPQFRDAGITRDVYVTWEEFREKLGELLATRRRVAMEYAAGAALPVVSLVDGGTIEVIRSLGAEVVTSADLIQISVARWSTAAREGHALASKQVNQAKDDAFALIRERLAAGKAITEREVQQFILQRFASDGLETNDPPIVGANEHSGDPHFEVAAEGSSPIRKGDWVLIDLWARRPGDEHVFSDITWVGYCGATVPDHHRKVWETVRGARDAALSAARDAWRAKRPIAGCEADDAAMRVIREAGFDHAIRHRTGHSLSAGPKTHGIGVNIDNLETHDTRLLLPGVGFTIEPGVYLPEFGVRSEINVYMDPASGPVVTSETQTDVIRLA